MHIFLGTLVYYCVYKLKTRLVGVLVLNTQCKAFFFVLWTVDGVSTLQTDQ